MPTLATIPSIQPIPWDSIAPSMQMADFSGAVSKAEDGVRVVTAIHLGLMVSRSFGLSVAWAEEEVPRHLVSLLLPHRRRLRRNRLSSRSISRTRPTACPTAFRQIHGEFRARSSPTAIVATWGRVSLALRALFSLVAIPIGGRNSNSGCQVNIMAIGQRKMRLSTSVLKFMD